MDKDLPWTPSAVESTTAREPHSILLRDVARICDVNRRSEPRSCSSGGDADTILFAAFPTGALLRIMTDLFVHSAIGLRAGHPRLR